MIYNAIQEVQHGWGLAGIAEKVKAVRRRRKWMVREKAHLLFCYDALRHFVQQFLLSRKC